MKEKKYSVKFKSSDIESIGSAYKDRLLCKVLHK